MPRRTISFDEEIADEDEDTRTRHLNADAVTYLRNVEASPTLVTIGLYLLALLVGGYLLTQLVWWQAVIGTVALIILLTLLLPWPGQGATVGSLTDTRRFDYDEKDGVLRQFERASLEYVTYVDERSGLFFNADHTYHLVPRSIDGITQTQRTNRLRAVASFATAAGCFVALPVLALPMPTAVVPALLVLYGLVLFVTDPEDVVVVRFRNGRSRTFTIDSADAEDLLADFADRRGDGRRILEVQEGPDAAGVIARLKRLIEGVPPPTHHVNADNVALVSRTNEKIRLQGFLAVAAVGILAAVAVWWAVPAWLAILGGVGSAAWLLFGLLGGDGAVVRTTACRYPVTETEVDDVIDRFSERVGDPLVLRGTASEYLTRTEYTHHIVPDGIVSLQAGRSLWPILRGLAVAAVGLAGLWVRGDFTVPGPPALGTVVTVVLIGAVAWGIVEVVRELLSADLRATFEDGATEAYPLSAADGESFIDRYLAVDSVVEADVLTRGWWSGSRLVNTGLIATFRYETRERTRRGLLLLVVLSAAAGILVWGALTAFGDLAESLPAPLPAGVVVAVALVSILLLKTAPREAIELVTINGRTITLDSVDADAFEEAFLAVSGDEFGFEGRVPSLIVDRTYETVFVADNVVSLVRKDRQARLSVFLTGLLGAYTVLAVSGTFMGSLILLTRHEVPIQWVLGALLLVGLLGWAATTIGKALYWEVGDLDVEVPDGSTIPRTVSPSDASSIVNRFGRRGN